MAINITLERGVRVIRFQGPVSNQSLIADLGEFWRSDAYDNSLNELYDVRGGGPDTALNGEGLKALADINASVNSDAPRVKVAIVVNSQLVFGLGRQIMAHLGDRYQADFIKLYDDYDEALNWLTE